MARELSEGEASSGGWEPLGVAAALDARDVASRLRPQRADTPTRDGIQVYDVYRGRISSLWKDRYDHAA